MFNAYDYDSYFGEGIQRGNLFAKFILFHVSLPVAGNLFCSLENKFILKNIMNGGFFDKTKLPDSYLNSLCTSLKKKGYVYHFRNVLSNFQTWVNCKKFYDAVTHPTVLVYGEADWSTLKERFDSQNKLKLDSYHTIKKCGHFSFLEQPKKVAEIINPT
jgi:pimeloyl-ACP methyl ester carboxylesterase